MSAILDFEQPLVELRTRLAELEKRFAGHEAHPSAEAARQEWQAVARELEAKTREVYSQLTAWQKVQLARSPARPSTLDYVQAICTEFVELHGDRTFADDPAVVGGPARIDGRAVMIVGHQKGRDTRENLQRNFGMPHPEGYRKALRLMRQAEKFSLPLVCLVDTVAASGVLVDEERGQSWALSNNLVAMAALQVPILVVVIGVGGSGGALAISVGDRLLMLEHAIYSVAPPEGCASIVWKDAKFAPQAAEALKLTAQDLLALSVIDRIVPEPLGGAHHDPRAATQFVRDAIVAELDTLTRCPLDLLLARRYEKFRRIGVFHESADQWPAPDGC